MQSQFPMIESIRLRLVPFDLPALRLARDGKRAEIARLLQLEVPADWPSRDVQEQQIPVQIERLEVSGHDLPWHGRLIVLRPGTLVGNINLKGPPDMAGDVEIGYEVLPAYRRQGIAMEAAELLIDWCFTQARVKRVSARTKPDNEASQTMLTKLGFRCVGSEHDAMIGEMLLWRLQHRLGAGGR